MRSPFLKSEGSLRPHLLRPFSTLASPGEYLIISSSHEPPFAFSSIDALPQIDLRQAAYSLIIQNQQQVFLHDSAIRSGYFEGLHLLLFADLKILFIDEYLKVEHTLDADLASACSRFSEHFRNQLETLPRLDGHLTTGRISTHKPISLPARYRTAIGMDNIHFLISASRQPAPKPVARISSDVSAYHPSPPPKKPLDDRVLIAIMQGGVAKNAMPPTKPEPERDRGIRSFMFLYSSGHEGSAREDVLCSVFSRPSVTAGTSFPIHVFLHRKEQLMRVAEEVIKKDRNARRRAFDTLQTQLRPGQPVTFLLDSQDLLIENPLETVIWNGGPEDAIFNAFVAPGMTGDILLGTVHIAVDGIPIGEIRFSIALVARSDQPQPLTFLASKTDTPIANVASVAVAVKNYKKAFLSYARKDVALVSIFAEGLSNSDLRLFVDVTAMEPGHEWSTVINDAIEQSDVFFLLWSENAAASSWVQKECFAACQEWEKTKKSRPAIKPIILRDGAPQPPFCISQFHCDSRWRHMRIAGERKMFGNDPGTQP